MANYKIIFTGPVGAGKTTAIAAISDIPPICTNEEASDMTRERKQSTTVAMDYGVMKINQDERIHLYGTPGQERFNFMWEILTEGGVGLILLLDNARPNSFGDMHFFLGAFKNFIGKNKVVIGITRTDITPAPGIEDYHRELQGTGMNVAIFEVDARKREDILMLLKALLYSIDPGLVAYE